MLMKLIRLLENLKTHQLHVMYLVKVFNKPYLKFWRERLQVCLHKVDVNIKPKLIQIDTTNILFILGGAFDGIDEVIKRRLGEKSDWICK